MKSLSKKEERLIRDKIAMWVRHQELDKFNYSDALVRLLGILAALITLIAICYQSVPNLLTKGQANWAATILMVAAVFVFFHAKYRMNVSNKHFARREQMIDEWYEELGVKKEELNKEFLKRYCKPCWLC